MLARPALLQRPAPFGSASAIALRKARSILSECPNSQRWNSFANNGIPESVRESARSNSIRESGFFAGAIHGRSWITWPDAGSCAPGLTANRCFSNSQPAIGLGSILGWRASCESSPLDSVPRSMIISFCGWQAGHSFFAILVSLAASDFTTEKQILPGGKPARRKLVRPNLIGPFSSRSSLAMRAPRSRQSFWDKTALPESGIGWQTKFSGARRLPRPSRLEACLRHKARVY